MPTVLASLIPEQFTETEVELLAVLVLATPWLLKQTQHFLWRGMHALHYRWGAFRAARLCMGILRHLPLSPAERTHLVRVKG